MKSFRASALAFFAASPLLAQTAGVPDLSYAVPLPGNWSYAAAADGSEATFRDASARPQLTLHCTKASRVVTIAKPASTASPFLSVWSSSHTRNVPASFDPATARASARLTAFDPLLDGIAYSRGRFAVGVSGAPPLVVPAWPEALRVIEDCRA